MPNRAIGWLAIIGLIAIGRAAVPESLSAQTTEFNVWPEVDIWKELNQKTRLYFPFSLSHAREVDYLEGTVGAALDYRIGLHVSVRAGYSYLWSISDTSYREHRPIGELTFRFFPGSGILLFDRNRFELRIIDGVTSWRYRNRVRAERSYHLRDNRSLTPYGTVEFGYDSRYDAINRVRLDLGVEYLFSRHVMLDSYLAFQDDDRASVQHVFALGLALNLTF